MHNQGRKTPDKESVLKSDNAGCYHNGAYLVSLRDIGVRVGIDIERYDFSETQSGKGICDRRIASMIVHQLRLKKMGLWLTRGEQIKHVLSLTLTIKHHKNA